MSTPRSSPVLILWCSSAGTWTEKIALAALPKPHPIPHLQSPPHSLGGAVGVCYHPPLALSAANSYSGLSVLAPHFASLVDTEDIVLLASASSAGTYVMRESNHTCSCVIRWCRSTLLQDMLPPRDLLERGGRGGGGPGGSRPPLAGTYLIHREQKNYWRMNNSAHGGNVCPARTQRATFLLTILTSALDLPSHGEAPQVDHVALHTFPTKHVA